MAGKVFGAGLDRDVDAAGVRGEEQRRRPGIVHQNAGAAGVRNLGDRRHVLNLETLRARRFGQHRLGVRPEQRLDPGADARVVEGRLDPHPLQHAVGEGARRAIGRVGHQEMIAGRQRRHQRHDDRREAGGDEFGSGRAGNVGPGGAKGLGRRRAVGAVGVALLAALQRRGVGIEHRRAAERREVDEALRLTRRRARDGRGACGFSSEARVSSVSLVIGLRTVSGLRSAVASTLMSTLASAWRGSGAVLASRQAPPLRKARAPDARSTLVRAGAFFAQRRAPPDGFAKVAECTASTYSHSAPYGRRAPGVGIAAGPRKAQSA